MIQKKILPYFLILAATATQFASAALIETTTDIPVHTHIINGTPVIHETSVVRETPIFAQGAMNEGEIIPEFNPFFPTILAQPHKLGYEIGYRTYDKAFKKSAIPISVGDQFSLYEFQVRPFERLYFGIEADVWALFEGKSKSVALINADYFIGLPLTYFKDNFCAKLRLFHESSHLGDEYMIEHPEVKRVNPSMEAIDLSLAWQFDDLHLFAGVRRVLRSDKSYHVKPNSLFYGLNYFFNDYKVDICNITATPYVSAYFVNDENRNWNLDSTLAIGYQWDKSYGHKLRAYIEAHDGYSSEGQFSKDRTRYLAVKLQYGY